MTPSACFASNALVLNPAAAARLELSRGRAFALHWRGLAVSRSWWPLRLTAAGPQASLFRVAWELLETGHVGPLASAVALPLWRAGLLLTPTERARVPDGPGPELERVEAPWPDWQPPDTAGQRLWRRLFADVEIPSIRARGAEGGAAGFAANRWAFLPGLLTATQAARIAAVWRQLEFRDLLRPAGDRGVCINNDPLGRAMLGLLTSEVEHLVGRPLRQSYSFATTYGNGARLDAHTDREQCEYTVSIMLDHRPGTAGRDFWPLEVRTRPDAATQFLQAPGDGVLFCGRELPHGRPALPPGASALVLMLHWVNADFPDAAMDRS
jgi:hypothetical protein